MAMRYPDRRLQEHCCKRMKVPAEILQNKSISTTPSPLSLLPGEIILHIRDFLNFKDRCCFALTDKYFASMMLEQVPEAENKFQIKNTERKEIEVHPCPEKYHPRLTAPIQPAKIVKHICGQYNEMLRLLSRDWNSTKRKLCPTCRAFRPRSEDYWRGKAVQDQFDLLSDKENRPRSSLVQCRTEESMKKYKAWCDGEENQCPDCGPDVWLRGGNQVDFPDPAFLMT